MTTLYDVPASLVIDKIAQELKSIEEVKPPSWAIYVKTGVHKEYAPSIPADLWWYLRCASLLRKIYLIGTIGTSRLRNHYGGRKDRGSKPYRFKKGGGAIIRNALKQLEQAGFVEIKEKEGRKLSNKGISFLDRIAHQIKLDLQKENPDLKKY